MSNTPLPDPKLGEPFLLTPGPLTTSFEVKEAMLKDWGSWDDDFRGMTRDLRSRRLALIGPNADDYDCIPIQGSGSYAVEAMLGSFVPKDGKVLVLANGAYGLRAAKTMEYLRRDFHLLDKGDYLPPRGEEVAAILANDPAITHVLAIHCETSSGILNPVGEIAEATKVPAAYLSKVLQAMSRAGLVRSQRGLHGGFQLISQPNQINILDVVNAVDPIQRIESCPLTVEHPLRKNHHLF